MRLHLSTWMEVEKYLETSKTIILPIGSTEQHGPTGLMGTDAVCPQALAIAAGARCETLVGPTFSIGIAQHHLGFAGTITLRPSTLIAVLRDAVTSLSKHGFEYFYFLNGHGGNMATLGAAFSEIYGERSLNQDENAHKRRLRCKQRNWWDGPRFKALSRELYGSDEGSHATCSEISLGNYLYPDHVKSAELTPEIAPRGPIYDADDYRSRFPDGRIGSRPSLCSVADGKRIFDAAVSDITEDIGNSFSSG